VPHDPIRQVIRDSRVVGIDDHQRDTQENRVVEGVDDEVEPGSSWPYALGHVQYAPVE
jgi:hypothetical protein